MTLRSDKGQTFSNKRSAAIIITAGAALAVTAVLSLFAGKYSMSFADVLRALVTGGGGTQARVIWGLRMPRTLMGVIAGAALGIAGYIYQTVFSNPLASPDLIGVAGGANLGAAAMIVLGAGSSAAITAGSFIGGIAAVLLAAFLARLSGRNGISFILAGLVINALSSAGVMALKYLADPENQLVSIEYWEMGTLGTVTWTRIVTAVIPALISIAGLFILSSRVTLLSLGDDECRALGVRAAPARAAILGFNTLLVASVVSVTGLISFVGLIAPHVSGLLMHKKGSARMALSALTGALVVLIADILSRTLSSAELPISILTTVTGVPVLVWLLIRKGAGNERTF